MNNVSFDGEELLALARLDVEQSKLDGALGKVKQALALQTPPSEIYSLGAKLYAQLQLFEKAKLLFTQFLELHPDSVTDKFQLGMVTFDSGNPTEALTIWQQLLEDHPTHPPTLYYASIAMAETKDLDGAMRNLDVLLKSAPVSNLYFERGKELLASLNKGEDKVSKPVIKEDFPYGTEN